MTNGLPALRQLSLERRSGKTAYAVEGMKVKVLPTIDQAGRSCWRLADIDRSDWVSRNDLGRHRYRTRQLALMAVTAVAAADPPPVDDCAADLPVTLRRAGKGRYATADGSIIIRRWPDGYWVTEFFREGCATKYVEVGSEPTLDRARSQLAWLLRRKQPDIPAAPPLNLFG